MSGPSEISERVTAIAAGTDAASDWIAEHGAVLGQGDTKLSHDFRRYKRRSVKLQQAVQRPMCLAVFGASQAGKSYLVSRLAAAPGKQLTARFDSQTLDFLSDINPPGGQEATGLVTRFTTRLPVTPPGAPVALRLLSQTDIIKILANTYLEDFDTDAMPLDAAEQEALFASLATRARPGPVDALTKDDAEDLFDYFNEYFP